MMRPDRFSDYIVYVDESGDHSLTHINEEFPVFVLVFCVFRIDQYVRRIVPAAQQLKFEFFGHDQVILHESEIRRRRQPFELLRDDNLRKRFLGRLSNLVQQAGMVVIAAVIDKRRMANEGGSVNNPYDLALRSCMERTQTFLQDAGASGRTTQIVFESRGKSEDEKLSATFDEVRGSGIATGAMPNLRYQFVSKKANSTGLQLADLIVRPIAMNTIRPGQRNRAYEVIEPKLWRNVDGNVSGYGLTMLP